MAWAAARHGSHAIWITCAQKVNALAPSKSRADASNEGTACKLIYIC
jgi:hypothetical protein